MTGLDNPIRNVGSSPPQQMTRLLVGLIPPRAIYAAVKIGLTDQIDSAGATAGELAQHLNVDARSLEGADHVPKKLRKGENPHARDYQERN